MSGGEKSGSGSGSEINSEIGKQMVLVMGGSGGGQWTVDLEAGDMSETVYIRPLALLRMLKHTKSGVPFEVMGILVGRVLDGYSMVITDAFPMPGVSTTEAVEVQDNGYQVEMMELMGGVGREEELVMGWYHSHPGLGVWLSATDEKTQRAFQSMAVRSVALVLDPVQSSGGNLVLGAFRVYPDQDGSPVPFLIPGINIPSSKTPRHVTSLVGLDHQRYLDPEDAAKEPVPGCVADGLGDFGGKLKAKAHYRLNHKILHAPHHLRLISTLNHLRHPPVLADKPADLIRAMRDITRSLTRSLSNPPRKVPSKRGDDGGKGRLLAYATRLTNHHILNTADSQFANLRFFPRNPSPP